MEDRIKVIDSYPSSGKTSWAIQYINSLDDDTKVIYLTPYLNEVDRIINSCQSRNFVQPNRKLGGGSKLKHLIELIKDGNNIVSTHALFSLINDELINALRVNSYVLFLDEVFQTVDKYDIADENLRTEVKDAITKQDVETLLEKQLIKIEDDYHITWVDSSKYLSRYKNIIDMSNRGLLYYVSGSLLLWSFPIEVFREGIFINIYILTHRFESQLQAYYYQYFDLEYGKYIVKHSGNEYYILKGESAEDELDWKQNVAKLITTVEDTKLNRLGDVYYDSRNHPYKSSLSKTWYSSNPEMIPVIRNNLSNYFINLTHSKVSDRLWTCFKEDNRALKSKNVSIRYWLACNARATNDYGDKTVLAYLLNRYLDTFYEDFFFKKGIIINNDEYALSEMIQWIWRSAIRNNKNITLYIPSLRMRTLLKKYFNNEKIEF